MLDRLVRDWRRLPPRVASAIGRQFVGPLKWPDSLAATAPIEIPAHYQPVRERNGTIRAQVPLEDMTTTIGFSFRPDGWHPFVATLRACAARPSMPYEESPLYRLQERFRPQTWQEVILDGDPVPRPPLHTWRVVRGRFLRPWGYRVGTFDNWSSRAARVDHPSSRHPRFGPHERGYGEAQFGRLLAVHESIARLGYAPDPDGPPIEGYFLGRRGDWRFLVTRGQRRLAALAVVGHPSVEVRVDPLHPATVVDRDLAYWTTDKWGVYPRVTAEALHRTMFEESGSTKARRLGLA